MGIRDDYSVVLLDIVEIDDAQCGVVVPLVHGVDGLSRLDQVPFVDAARIDPNPFETFYACCRKRHAVGSGTCAEPEFFNRTSELVKCGFFRNPTM